MLSWRVNRNLGYFIPVALQPVRAFDGARLNAAATVDKAAEPFYFIDRHNSLELIEQFIFSVREDRRAGYGHAIAECRNTSMQAGCENYLRPADDFADQPGSKPLMAQIHPPAHLGKLFGAIAMAPANGKNHRAGHSFRIHRLQQRFNGGV